MPVIRTSQARRALLALSLALIAGCTASGPAGLATQQAAPMPQQQGGQDQQQDPLGLSQEQQQKLGQAFATLAPSSEQKQLGQRIQQVLLADVVDIPALEEALDNTHQSLIQNVDKIISAFQALRETLTPNQQNTLISLLQQESNQSQQAPQYPAELNLTPDQKAALSSLQTSGKGMNQAMIDYLSSGNGDALRQAITNDIAAMPKPDAVAKALASLTKEQRQKMFGQQQQQQQQQGQQGQ